MEVRSITPNYTNNATTFGMAFRKPKADAMEEFVKFVTKKDVNSVSLAKRGVAKIIDRHSKDVHFDFEYTGAGKFEIVPISAKAKEMLVLGNLPGKVEAPKGIIEKTREKYFSEAYKAEADKATGFKAFWMSAKAIAAGVKARLALEFKPVDSLPKKFRDASSMVTAYEKAVRKQLAKEAKEAAAAEKQAAKQAKAAEKARIAAEKKAAAKEAAKQKAMEQISSVFDPKKK